ncbi:hypothetical protein QL285_029388 [Trifolium repens]|nr:hypothetical protein QL285_029388 [Trifolium repens]
MQSQTCTVSGSLSFRCEFGFCLEAARSRTLSCLVHRRPLPTLVSLGYYMKNGGNVLHRVRTRDLLYPWLCCQPSELCAPFYVTARAFGVPGTATSRSSPTPFSIGVFAFRGNRTHVPGDKYMSNPFPLPIGLVAQLVAGMDWTCTYPQVHGFDSHRRQKLQ